MRKYCVITLRSVFVQGIRALDTLSPYIYYELLVKVITLNTKIKSLVYCSCCYPVPINDYPPTTSSPALAPLSLKIQTQTTIFLTDSLDVKTSASYIG